MQVMFRSFGLFLIIFASFSSANAAPRPLAKNQSVAFASEAFRKQERNFAVPKAAEVNARMSLAQAPIPDGPIPVLVKKHGRGVEPEQRIEAAGAPDGEQGGFGEPSLWRVRGIGSAAISSVQLD